jgi:hypothetical protein
MLGSLNSTYSERCARGGRRLGYPLHEAIAASAGSGPEAGRRPAMPSEPPRARPDGGERPRTCILVAGMHRSGTSAATRMINLLGADVTRKLAPPQAGINERGFWESTAIFPIHDEMLLGLGSAWDDSLPLPDGWLESEVVRQAKAKLLAEINADFSNSQVFVVKDPRLARLLPLWLEMLDELGVESIIVVPFRHPLEVAQSLAKRDRLPTAASLLLYTRSNLEVELASRGRPRVLVPYEQLLADWRRFAARLREIMGSRLPPPSAAAAAEIDNFLAPDLHHEKFSRETLAAELEVPAVVVETYERMVEAVAQGDDTVLRRPFDRLRETVAEATKLYQGLVLAERQRSSQKIDDLNREHDAVVGQARAERKPEPSDAQ